MRFLCNIAEIPHVRNNQTELEYRLAWARTCLKKANIIIKTQRKTWSIYPKYINVSTLSDEDITLITFLPYYLVCFESDKYSFSVGYYWLSDLLWCEQIFFSFLTMFKTVRWNLHFGMPLLDRSVYFVQTTYTKTT